MEGKFGNGNKNRIYQNSKMDQFEWKYVNNGWDIERQNMILTSYTDLVDLV